MFLQRPANVSELFGARIGGARLGQEVPLDEICTGVTSVMFCVHLPMHVSKGCQPFLPRDDGTLSAIQLPLPSKDLPL
jgi:hypothetical protein